LQARGDPIVAEGAQALLEDYEPLCRRLGNPEGSPRSSLARCHLLVCVLRFLERVHPFAEGVYQLTLVSHQPAHIHQAKAVLDAFGLELSLPHGGGFSAKGILSLEPVIQAVRTDEVATLGGRLLGHDHVLTGDAAHLPRQQTG